MSSAVCYKHTSLVKTFPGWAHKYQRQEWHVQLRDLFFLDVMRFIFTCILHFVCRCNGSFQLVDEHVRGFGSCIYLSGISGDNIAYVTQASDSLTMALKKGRIQGEIAEKNFYHTEERLYIDVNESDLQHFKSSKEHRWQVDVSFCLKNSYFDSLQRFVCSLTQVIINRLLPSHFLPFSPVEEGYDALNLQTCSEDQRSALAVIVACPVHSPPILVTGPFGTGKTRILALAAHYFLQRSTRVEDKTCILVCTQQHVSADAFLDCLMSLVISIPDAAYVARVKYSATKRHQRGNTGSVFQRHQRSLDDFVSDYKQKPPTKKRPYLIVTTCQAAHGLKRRLPREFYFTHILLDEVAQMREAEAVAPLCLANSTTKIVLAGDKQQVRTSL